jgi:peroxiredoxin
MIKQSLLIFSVLSSLLPPLVHAALDRFTDFALLDADGSFHQLSRYQHRDALVIMSYNADCPATTSQLQAFQQARAEFEGENVEFLLIDSLDQGRETLARMSLEVPILDDAGQLVSETLGISQSGEVLIFNPLRKSLYYRGTASTSLEEVLNDVLAGNITDTLVEANFGCDVEYVMAARHRENPPDYAADVAPIIENRCAECHRQGGVGPFAMDSYIMLLGWSPMIKEVLLNKRMPPTQVDPFIGHSENARYIPNEELLTIVHWIDAGAPRGSSEEDPLELIPTITEQWALGEPDFIVNAPEHEVPSTGVLDYYYKTIELPFDEDKWVRAIQYRAGDPSVLHHLMTFVTPPEEDFWGPEREELSVARRFLGGFSPGSMNVTAYPEGTGVLVPAGHSLSMQFHYVTNGQATTDATQIGLYFSDTSDLKELLTQAVSTRFELPANTADFPQQASHVFDEEVALIAVRARMNQRGKRMKFSKQALDGSEISILSVPAYNYGWQPNYLLSEPVILSAGESIVVSGGFDNSVSNPNNPDPDKVVPFGLESWEEMFSGYVTYYSLAP